MSYQYEIANMNHLPSDKRRSLLQRLVPTEKEVAAEVFDVNDLNTGCVLDGANRGHYIVADIILEAESLGWDGGDRDEDGRNAIDVANDYRNGADYCLTEFIGEDSEAAEAWLNENRCADGHAWGMWEGSFYYETEEWWEELDY